MNTQCTNLSRPGHHPRGGDVLCPACNPHTSNKVGAGLVSSAPRAVSHQRVTLTEAQEVFFDGTHAADESGVPLVLFHGSGNAFERFDDQHVGRGNDQWGAGYYFTDQRSVAEGYAADYNSPDACVREFHLQLRNPLYVDGREALNLSDVELPREQVLALLRHHPDIYRQPSDDSGEMNPLGDYSAEFWDREQWSTAEIDQMIDVLADEHFQTGSLMYLESFFGREHGGAYLKGLRSVTGHDGVIVDFGDDGRHFVCWGTDQMKLTTTNDPDGADRM